MNLLQKLWRVAFGEPKKPILWNKPSYVPPEEWTEFRYFGYLIIIKKSQLDWWGGMKHEQKIAIGERQKQLVKRGDLKILKTVNGRRLVQA